MKYTITYQWWETLALLCTTQFWDQVYKCRFVSEMFSIFVGFFVLLEIILTQKVSKEGTMIMFWDQGWKIRSRPFSPPTTSFFIFSRNIGFPFSFQAPVTLSNVTQLSNLRALLGSWSSEKNKKIFRQVKKGLNSVNKFLKLTSKVQKDF